VPAVVRLLERPIAEDIAADVATLIEPDAMDGRILNALHCHLKAAAAKLDNVAWMKHGMLRD
jgi:hypothetical protein